jgi:hypothetical protein
MTPLIVAAFFIFMIWLIRRMMRRTATSRASVVTLETRLHTAPETLAPDVDQGPLTAAGPSSWILNPKSPLPMTVVGVSHESAAELKSLLERAQYWSEKIPQIAYIIAATNAKFQEVDDFISKCKPIFDAEIESLKAASPDWKEASERDREALMDEFRQQAKAKMPVHAEGIEDLLSGEPTNISIDDTLLRRFGGNATLYEFYLSTLGRAGKVQIVKAEASWRKSWEELVGMGLALRGKDIPRNALLETLKLADLNDLLRGTTPKPLTRKAPAIDALIALPDLDARLSDRISYREHFLIQPPGDVDVKDLRNCFAYASALALLVQSTYFSARNTLRTVQEYQEDPSSYDGWSVTNTDEPVPQCAVQYCRDYKRKPKSLPPFHIGCTCELELM